MLRILKKIIENYKEIEVNDSNNFHWDDQIINNLSNNENTVLTLKANNTIIGEDENHEEEIYGD